MTIKELRERNNLSQREFAAMIGVTQTAIYKWELKDTKINEIYQRKIENIFKIEPSNKRMTSFNI